MNALGGSPSPEVKQVLEQLRDKIRQTSGGGPGSLTKAFKLFRYKGRSADNVLIYSEWQQALEHLSLQLPEHLSRAVFDAIDRDKKGINLAEFIERLMEHDEQKFVDDRAEVDLRHEEEQQLLLLKKETRSRRTAMSHRRIGEAQSRDHLVAGMAGLMPMASPNASIEADPAEVTAVLEQLRDKIRSSSGGGAGSLMKAFKLFRYKGRSADNVLIYSEWKQALQHLSLQLPEHLSRAVFDSIDRDKNGITRGEFIAHLMEHDRRKKGGTVMPQRSVGGVATASVATPPLKQQQQQQQQQQARGSGGSARRRAPRAPKSLRARLAEHIVKGDSAHMVEIRHLCAERGGVWASDLVSILHGRADVDEMETLLRSYGAEADGRLSFPHFAAMLNADRDFARLHTPQGSPRSTMASARSRSLSSRRGGGGASLRDGGGVFARSARRSLSPLSSSTSPAYARRPQSAFVTSRTVAAAVAAVAAEAEVAKQGRGGRKRGAWSRY